MGLHAAHKHWKYGKHRTRTAAVPAVGPRRCWQLAETFSSSFNSLPSCGEAGGHTGLRIQAVLCLTPLWRGREARTHSPEGGWTPGFLLTQPLHVYVVSQSHKPQGVVYHLNATNNMEMLGII